MRTSFEFNNNNKKRKQSWDKYAYSRVRNSLHKKRRKSMMNFESTILKKAKKDFENQKKNKIISYYSNAKLNILNILNTYINDDIYNNISYNIKQNNKLNNNDKKNNKIKDIKKKNTKSSNDSYLKKYISDKSNNIKFKYLSLLDIESLNPKRKTNNLFDEKEIENKKTNSKNLNHLGYHRKSVDLSHLNKKALMNLKNKHNFYNNKRNSISVHLNRRSSMITKKGNESLIKDMSEIEIIKMNEHIYNDINLLQLKKKISDLKKSIKSKCANIRGEGKDKNNKEITLHSAYNNSNIDEYEKTSENTNDNNSTSILIKKATTKKIFIKEINFVNNKYRKLSRKANLFDSIDDEEYLDEEINYYISSNSLFIKFFDIFILISTLIYFIFIPYFLSQNLLISKENNLLKAILIFIDVIYIIDIIINFFREYKNFDENIIKKTKKIFFHYLKSWFLIDLIQAFPYFSLFNFLENKYNLRNQKIYFLLMIKAIKIYKIQEDNTAISYLSELFSKSEIIDENKSNIEIIFIFLSYLNIATCLYIFLGRNSYQSWIIKMNIQDESYINIYLTSLYFVIVTITTVGYGDITGDTIPEILFQILLLILGTIAYSFIISYFSNYIVKINQKSLNFENKLNILNEIKLHHPNMKNSLYKEVLRNLHNEEFYEKKDKQILFQGLPYSLKNKLIMEMYKPIIKNFIFFKDVDNSDFIVKVATSLKPLISIKGDILIQEGDFIKEIIYIKKGVMGLNLCINLNSPLNSIQKYFNLIEIEKFNTSNIKSSILNQNNKKLLNSSLDSFLFNKVEDSSYIENDDDNANIEDINIIEIRNKEHFGDALMFLNEPCPLNARIRTKTAELLILRKMEAIEIYSIYPNIWKRINKKSLYNMEQIYLKIKKTLIEISNRYNIKFFKKNLNKEKIVINKKKNNDNNLNNIKNDQKKIKKPNKEKKSDLNKGENNIIKIDIKNFETQTQNECFSQNMTFIKKQSIRKDIKEEESLKVERKKSENFINNIKDSINESKSKDELIRIIEKNKKKENNLSEVKSILKISKSNDNSKNDEFFEDREINNEIYNNESFNLNFKKNIFSKNVYSNINNSFYEIKFDNLNNSNNCSSIKNNLSSRLLISKNEKPNIKFNNLTSTKENSIHLNSSYENINKISNYKYINDINLQNKTKLFINDECKTNLISPRKKNKPSYLRNSVGNYPSIKINYEKKNSIKTSMEKVINNNIFNNNINSKIPLKNLNVENNEYEYDITCKSENESPTNKQKITLFHRINSYRSNSKNKMSTILSPIRGKKKQLNKKSLIGIKLNVISKNIQNANEAINNPNEFYINFFNNIIQKESSVNINEDNEKIKKNTKLSSSVIYTGNKSSKLRSRLSVPKLSIKKNG